MAKMHTNRLANETSPYLLQHQHNPVDWYSWGPEALERARREDKPIFLSVGYSTCYWCHVMERQCFENEAIAKEMNERFVNIKVDREERPDLDQLYMTAVQVLTRHGGWPMSVWLTPELKPFYGGTYFPPEDTQGRPGFVTILRGIDDHYRNRRDEVTKAANQLQSVLEQLAAPALPDAPIEISDDLVTRTVERSVSDYDPAYGGFGGAPKFPRQTLLELLLTHNLTNPHRERMRMVGRTLDAMAMGGVRDQLGGGFHRYSTDAKWLVPHFEIMLYDNAMLAWCYTEQYRQTEDLAYAGVAREVLDFVLREMTSPEGAFYTAIDAEVDTREGASYLWTAEQIEQVLGEDDARIFNRVYGVDRGPNFADPHHGNGTPDHNILYLPKPIPAAAEDLEIDEDDLVGRLKSMRRKLKAARDARKQPLLDTKILTSWNGLMIRALAYAGRRLGEPRYVAAAERAAQWLLKNHTDADANLYRSSHGKKLGHRAFLDDYAFLCHGLLELDEAGTDGDFREVARSYASVMIGRFADDASGGFFYTDDYASDIIVRQKLASDSPMPSGNAVAIQVLVDLGEIDFARRSLAVFSQQVENHPEGMSAMVVSMIRYLTKGDPFVVPPSDEGVKDRPLPPERVAAGVVEMNASWATPRELHLRLDILRGFHINTNIAAADMIPTRLTITGQAAHDVAGIDYPPGESRKMAFTDEDLRLYETGATIAVRFNADQHGEAPIRLSLSYQACSDDACLPPVTRTIDVNTP